MNAIGVGRWNFPSRTGSPDSCNATTSPAIIKWRFNDPLQCKPGLTILAPRFTSMEMPEIRPSLPSTVHCGDKAAQEECTCAVLPRS